MDDQTGGVTGHRGGELGDEAVLIPVAGEVVDFEDVGNDTAIDDIEGVEAGGDSVEDPEVEPAELADAIYDAGDGDISQLELDENEVDELLEGEILDDDDDTIEESVSPLPPPPPKKRGKAKPESTQTVRVEVDVDPPKRRRRSTGRRRSAQEGIDGLDELAQLMNALDPGGSRRIKVQIHRVEPQFDSRGNKVSGFLDTTEEFVDLDYLKRKYGPGTYMVRISGPTERPDGSWGGNKFLRSKKVEIASGDPSLHERDRPDDKATASQDPDIVTRVLESQEKAQQRQDAKDREEKQRIIDTMGAKGDNSDVVGMMTKMMELQQSNAAAALKATELQIELLREEAKAAREEAARKDEAHRREMQEAREKAEEGKGAASTEMVSFMREQNSDAAKRSETMMDAVARINETHLKMVQDNSESQINLLVTSSKQQVDMLTSELRRVSDELKDTRIQGKTDLASEIKKITSIQELVKNIGGTGDEKEKTLTDKLSDNLPEILDAVPDIVKSFGDLFRGEGRTQARTRVRTIPQRRAIQPPPRTPKKPEPEQRKSSFPTDITLGEETEGSTQAPERKESHTQADIDIGKQIIKLEHDFGKSLEAGESPDACYEKYIKGQYDTRILQDIANAPFIGVMTVLQEELDSNSPLFSVMGKDFLRGIHVIIRKHHGQ